MLDPVDSGWRGSHHRFEAASFPMLCCPTSERRKENKVAVCWSFHVTALTFVYERDNFARDVGRVLDIAASIDLAITRLTPQLSDCLNLVIPTLHVAPHDSPHLSDRPENVCEERPLV